MPKHVMNILLRRMGRYMRLWKPSASGLGFLPIPCRRAFLRQICAQLSKTKDKKNWRLRAIVFSMCVVGRLLKRWKTANYMVRNLYAQPVLLPTIRSMCEKECLTSACISGQFRNQKLRNLLTYYKILDIKRKEEMKIKQLLLFVFVTYGYLFHASCEDDMANIVTDEPVKDITGSWKVIQLTRNGEDLSQRLNLTDFRIDFKEDGSYTLANGLPFVLVGSGTYTLNDPQYP